MDNVNKMDQMDQILSKIRVFGIGNCGKDIISKIKCHARMSKIAIGTDIHNLYLRKNGNIDLNIICGHNTCKGLGCGGNASQGYKAAKESFSNLMSMFYDNCINIFVIGLGGGTGSGITNFILKAIAQSPSWCTDHHRCNIVFCMFPFKAETKRINKAKKILQEIEQYADLIIVIDQEKMSKNWTTEIIFPKKFEIFNVRISDYISKMSQLSNQEIIDFVEEYKKKKKIIRIEKPLGLDKYFNLGEKRNPLSKMDK